MTRASFNANWNVLVKIVQRFLFNSFAARVLSFNCRVAVNKYKRRDFI